MCFVLYLPDKNDAGGRKGEECEALTPTPDHSLGQKRHSVWELQSFEPLNSFQAD